MNESLLNRILKDRKRRTRSLALILCLSMIVSLGTFAGFRKTAVAKVYTREVLDCPYTHEGAEPVAHVHNDDCYEGNTLVCTLPELEAHTHSDACYTEREVLTCTLEENPGHQHGDACYTEHEELRCGLEENPGHQHGDACYDENGVLTCQIPEGEGAHTHTAECYETVRELTCQIPEGEGAHTHSAECYETVRELTCDKSELPVHVHGPECFRTEEITADEPEATTAPEMPVSDPNADIETASDWEHDFDGMELSGNWAQDLVLVAATQQGHGESQNNFEAVLNDAGDAWVRHGYTRYGAWYGAPYMDEWSAMFVSFCLRYAGIPAENVPNNPTAALMAESFQNGELFAGPDYLPAVGDLIFFDTDGEEGIDHMGIVYHVDEENGSLNTVEGARTDAVETFGYKLDDEEIAGYGILPQNPNFVPDVIENEDNIEGEDDGFIVMTTDEEEEKKETEEVKPVEETKTAEEGTAPAVPMPAQSWERTAGGIKVSVEAPEGAFPENTKIAVTPVNGNSLKDTVSDAVSGEVLEVQAVDITFFDADGREIEPALPIRVAMTPAATQNAEEKTNVVHIDLDQQTAEVIEQAAGTETDNSEVVFDADAFTIYAIVYTYQVEYEYEVDGKTFTSSMPGAENMTLTQIVEGLGIVEETEIDIFVSKISSIASTNEEVAIITENNEIRVLKDGEAQIVITMQDGAVFQIRVIANGETEVTSDNVAISTVGDLYLPENAEVKAAVVDGENAIEAVKAETGEDAEYTVFDISLDNVDAEQYEEGFEVTVALDSNITGRDFRLYHVHEGVMEDITASLALEGPVDENGVRNVTAFSFQTESFSNFVLSYTVDFFYGEYEYHLTGRGMMLLSDLFRALGIDRTVDDVSEVVFSNPEVLSVSKNEENSDWILVSLMPFTSEETLTVTMKNGDVVTINVTDAVSESEAFDALNNDGYIDLANEDNTQFLHVSAESSVTETEQERDAAFKLTFTYSLEEDVVKAIDQYDQPFSLKYDLTSTINSSPLEIRNNSNGVISIGSRKLGTYTIVDGVVTLHFTDPSFFDGRTSFTGYFNLTAETNETELGSYDKWTYSFPGTGDTIPIHYKKTVEEGSKNVNSIKNADGSYTLHYTANINVNSDLDSLTFYDTLSGLQTLDASSVKINGTSVSVSQTGNGFNFDVASALGTTGVAKGSYQVTYDTKVTAAQLEAMTADQTIEKNTASWKVNGDKDVPGGETTVEINKPVPPIPVEKTSSSSGTNQPGDTITYNVSYGDANTALAGFHISDSITDVVIPQGTNVTLNYGNGQTVTVPFNSQATDSSYNKGMVTLFDYTFPADAQGNGPVTVTYSVKLIDGDTAKENGVYDTTSVANTAVEHRQNTSDTETTTVTYEKEPTYTVDKTASATPTDENGHWLPGSTITYTLTIGDADTNMAGVNIKDVMTDLQVLQGDIMIQVGNGSQMKLSDYDSDAIKWTDDGQYSANDVELFNFNMPSNAGNGPVVISYTTKVISQDQASANGIYGDQTIRNTGNGGKQSDGTSGTGVFEPFPIGKTVMQTDVDVNHQTVDAGSTVHYTLTFGKEGMNLANAIIEDQMTDIQKLVSSITITKKDGTSFIMPEGTGQWSEAGNNWAFWDDGRYDPNQRICLFRYRLPADIGEGPITIEYDAQLISEDEAKESGISGTKSAFNYFSYNGITAETEVKIDLPKEATHNPKIQKDFNSFDVENSIVYWDIVVEKDSASAYPLENVVVAEQFGDIHITEPSQGYNNNGTFSGANFDMTHAVVTTDDGTVLTPGVDYTIDKTKAKFTFPVINERVHIKLAFLSPAKIIDGYKVLNTVAIENPWQTDNAEAEYRNPKIQAVKNGTYTENDRLIKWEVIINPSLKVFDESTKRVLFEDVIPDGLTLVNYTSKSADNPTIFVEHKGNICQTNYDKEYVVTIDSEGKISADITPMGYDYSAYDPDLPGGFPLVPAAGLSNQKYVVTYYTLLSQEEWDRITSSASGSETFENKVTITAGDGEQFGDSDDVTVTTDGYLKKFDTTQDPGDIVIDPVSGENSKNITYSVEINPNGYVLNSHETLSLTDYISTNMDLDTASVQIYNAHKGADGRLVAENTVPVGLQVSYNDDSRLLSIQNIPDETPLLLTYTCVARAQGLDTFRNTATLIGGGSHSSSTTEEHNIQTNDAGILIDGIELSLHKIDENNISQNLSGAKFQLYECKLEIGELTNPETYNQDWWEALLAKVDRMTAGTATQEEIDDVKTNFKITEYVPIGDPVETKNTGFTQWSSLNEHKLYAWVETEAPENYSGYAPDDYHYFVGYQHIDVNSDNFPQPLLPADEQLARKHAAWALDDACQFANGIRVASMSNLTTWTATNVESHYTSISASKEWDGDSDNLFETRPTDGIQLQLWVIKADGTRETVGAPVSINVSEDTGEWPTYIWNRLPSEDGNGNTLKYTVTEKRVENYSTTYSDNGAGQNSGTITVTNKMIPKSTDIYVEKAFADGTEKPASIKVTLYVIKTDKDDVVSEPEETSYEAILSETNNWKWHWDKLPTTQVIDGKAYYLSYTVIEDTAALEREGFRYTVSYSDNGEGVIETTEDEPLLITNAKETGKIIVKKTFAGVTDETDLAALQAGLTVTVSGKDVGGEGVDTLTLKWDDVKENGYEITGLPLNETYTVTESLVADDVLPKYTVTSETVSSKTVTATKEGETAELKNIYEVPQTGSLKIQKTGKVNGADPTEDNKAKIDGEYSFTIAGKPDTATKDNSVTVKITLSKGVATAATKEGTSVPADVTVSVTGGVVTIGNLPLGTYTVTENLTEVQKAAGIRLTSEDPGDLTVTADSTTIPTATFVNNYETTSATVSKTWAGNGTPPRTLEVALVADGEVTTQEVTLSSTNSWADTITGLPKYKNETEILYTWLEKDLPDGYFLTGSTVNGTITSLTNTYQTYDLKTSYVGIKYWGDENNKYSTRPNDLTVTLTALYWNETTGDYGDPVPLDNTPTWNKDKANQWTYTFSDLPVFDGNGNVIKYSAQETEPAGYKLTSTTSKPTEWQLGSITYSNGTDRTTTDNKVVWTLGSLIDLSFVAIKPTSNGDVVVWTHRTPVPSEVTAITNEIKGGALPGCSNRNIVFYSGTGDVYTPHGNVTVTYDNDNLSVTLDFGSTSVWSQFIVGQFNKDNSSSYDVGTTEFTNALDTTELNGKKTWSISGTEIPENPILTLTRTVTTMEGEGEEKTPKTSDPEIVTVIRKVEEGGTTKEEYVNLQPTWSGTGNTRSFTYSGLPKYDKAGNKYTYSVSEYQFTVNDVTYTVTKDKNGDYVATPNAENAPKFKVTQEENSITNTEVTDFEFSKKWLKAGGDEADGWKDTITVQVVRQIGDTIDTNFKLQYTITPQNYNASSIAPAEGSSGTESLKPQNGTGFTFKVEDLEKYGKIAETEGEFTYYVKETVPPATGYMPPMYMDADNNSIQTGTANGNQAPNQGSIVNQENAGVELPETGGIGTTLFTALGGLMTVTAGVILTLRRTASRRRGEKQAS